MGPRPRTRSWSSRATWSTSAASATQGGQPSGRPPFLDPPFSGADARARLCPGSPFSSRGPSCATAFHRQDFPAPMPRCSRHSAAMRTTVGLSADRKSTRLNSSHLVISYAVFCLKKKKIIHTNSFVGLQTCHPHATYNIDGAARSVVLSRELPADSLQRIRDYDRHLGHSVVSHAS